MLMHARGGTKRWRQAARHSQRLHVRVELHTRRTRQARRREPQRAHQHGHREWPAGRDETPSRQCTAHIDGATMCGAGRKSRRAKATASGALADTVTRDDGSDQDRAKVPHHKPRSVGDDLQARAEAYTREERQRRRKHRDRSSSSESSFFRKAPPIFSNSMIFTFANKEEGALLENGVALMGRALAEH